MTQPKASENVFWFDYVMLEIVNVAAVQPWSWNIRASDGANVEHLMIEQWNRDDGETLEHLMVEQRTIIVEQSKI